MASIEEVWGSPFPKRQPLNSKSPIIPEKRDAQKEGRVYATPQQRSQAAMFAHRKTIDDLSRSLPIVTSDEEAETNYRPFKSRVRENFSGLAPEFPYAAPSFEGSAQELKLNRILHMIEQNRTGYEPAPTQDVMLYVFTGLFFLFTLDTFVTLGRRMR